MPANELKLSERPILFTPANVRKIMDGHKTQTRRVVKREHQRADEIVFGDEGDNQHLAFGRWGEAWVEIGQCPYGTVGDRLWVRESAQLADVGPGKREFSLRYKADEWPNGTTYHFSDQDRGAYQLVKWTPSIYMPRWASRVTLEITKLRIERLQEISEQDANAEGFMGPDEFHPSIPDDACGRTEFADCWNGLNAKRGYGWKENPWVWVITFKTVT